MVTPVEWGFLALLTTLTGLLSAWIVYRVIKPGLKRAINGYFPLIGKTIRSEMGNIMQEATEGLDLGAIAGQLGGGEGGSLDLGAFASMLGGKGGGLEGILGLLGQFTGKQTTKGKGKMGL